MNMKFLTKKTKWKTVKQGRKNNNNNGEFYDEHNNTTKWVESQNKIQQKK